jgi:uncharacterized cupin superfamily protein
MGKNIHMFTCTSEQFRQIVHAQKEGKGKAWGADTINILRNLYLLGMPQNTAHEQFNCTRQHVSLLCRKFRTVAEKLNIVEAAESAGV